MIPALLPVAAGAVQTAANVAAGAASAASAATASAATAGADFSAALTQAAGDAIKTMRTAETTSMSGIEGKDSVQQVVDGVMSAERTLQTTLAIRDKAVAAYQQISQMQI
jgi:flagellar hook-basal body complex protein FliE